MARRIRHNFEAWGPSGYGHVMLLNIRNVVDPVSRGLLVDSFDPDYPPLSYACDDAHRQGGIVIWCHNGQGMEAPVAAALGNLDAFNLFDPNWMDVEYDIYYRMLNAGIRLPASTGSDWFICSANRVYAYTGAEFEYPSWLDALKNGRTFITNGPALSLEVEGHSPGDEIAVRPGERLSVLATWQSHRPVAQAELVLNGRVIASETYPDGSQDGRLEVELPSLVRRLDRRASFRRTPGQLPPACLRPHQPGLRPDRCGKLRTRRRRPAVRRRHRPRPRSHTYEGPVLQRQPAPRDRRPVPPGTASVPRHAQVAALASCVPSMQSASAVLYNAPQLKYAYFRGHTVRPSEIIFEVTEGIEGGYDARALGYSIFTFGDSWDDLKEMVQDAVLCHFDDGCAPRVVRISLETSHGRQTKNVNLRTKVVENQ